jgi:hypothetical protein
MVVQESPGGASGWLRGVELEQLSDEAYFLRMRACGSRVRQWDDRYIGLLAGAVERELPHRRGFLDIFHMAGLQARMSRKKVTEVLRIARAIRGCPGLWRLFTRAEVAWTKIRVIAAVARSEWDADLCALVTTQTRKELESWVRERARELGRPGPAPLVRSASIEREGEPARDGAPSPPREEALPPQESAAGATSSTPPESRPEPTGVAFHMMPPHGDASSQDSSSTASGATLPHEAESGDPPDGRAARATDIAWMLASMGVDPMAIEKLRIDREALAAKGVKQSLAWVLEQAILAYRPSSRAARLPYLSVLWRCPGCRNGFVASESGPLPADDADEPKLRQSGATVDLEREIAERGLLAPERPANDFPSQACPPDESAAEAKPGRTRNASTDTGPPRKGSARPPVSARDKRLLMALQQGRCAVRGCRRPALELHHLDGYDPAVGHDLRKMHMICRMHHEMVHAGWFENPEDPPWEWRTRRTPAAGPAGPGRRRAVERKYRDHKHAAARPDDELAASLASEDEDVDAESPASGDQEED